MNIAEIITAVLSSSALTGIGTYLATKQKQQLSGDEQVRATFQKLLEDERKENHINDSKVIELTCRIEQLITENAALKTQIQHLEIQLDDIKNLFLNHCEVCPARIKAKVKPSAE